jgi:hypothetical protein
VPLSPKSKINASVRDQIEEINKKNKFSEEDKRYLKQREEFAVSVGFNNLFEYIDQFGLYAGAQTIGRSLFTYEIIKRTIKIPGHIVEFGVWKGSNLLFMTKVLKLLQPSTYKLVFGFDNFKGLPNPVVIDGAFAKDCIGKYRGDEKILRHAIKLYELDEWCHLIVGNAVQTIKQFEKTKPEVLVSLAWIDFDIYEPCVVALDFLSRRLAVGGLIVFDEGISHLWPGETTAMLEFLNKSGGTYKMESNTISRQPTMMIIKES